MELCYPAESLSKSINQNFIFEGTGFFNVPEGLPLGKKAAPLCVP